MRALFWLITLAALATGVALLGEISDGYVLWVVPPWRVELSFNLYVLMQALVLFVAYLAIRGIAVMIGMPRVVADYQARRAREHDERLATETLRMFWEGRYAQALKSAEKVDAGKTGAAQGIAALVSLKSASALRDEKRTAHWRARAEALDAAGWRTARLMAEMRIALDARDFAAARIALEQLGPKERRQISVQRLALRLAQGQGDWAALLRIARLLEKHHALTPEQARPLRLSAHRGMIDTLRDDPPKLLAYWRAMPDEDRADAALVRRAAGALARAGACAECAELTEDALAQAWEPGLLADYALGPGGDTLGRIAHCEKWLEDHPHDADLLLALGRLCRQQHLWGKAQSYLEASLALKESRAAHVELAQLLDRLEKSALAERHYRAAALL